MGDTRVVAGQAPDRTNHAPRLHVGAVAPQAGRHRDRGHGRSDDGTTLAAALARSVGVDCEVPALARSLRGA
jgi:hypothetical protein